MSFLNFPSLVGESIITRGCRRYRQRRKERSRGTVYQKVSCPTLSSGHPALPQPLPDKDLALPLFNRFSKLDLAFTDQSAAFYSEECSAALVYYDEASRPPQLATHHITSQRHGKACPCTINQTKNFTSDCTYFRIQNLFASASAEVLPFQARVRPCLYHTFLRCSVIPLAPCHSIGGSKPSHLGSVAFLSSFLFFFSFAFGQTSNTSHVRRILHYVSLYIDVDNICGHCGWLECWPTRMPTSRRSRARGTVGGNFRREDCRRESTLCAELLSMSTMDANCVYQGCINPKET